MTSLPGTPSGKMFPFQPFAIETDYRSYVDGKPRIDGLKSFLESRGITLPEGGPDDPADAETIHNLGKQKNEDFLQRVKEKGVKVYETTVALIHKAKKHGLKTAIISSSKSCAMILDSAHLSDLFDAKVDGVDSENLGIPGKPAPDIFLEAARQLQVKPGRAVVIEDAVSGVQAGRSGGFGWVIGIARHGGKEALEEHGADIVVEDLAEIHLTGEVDLAEPLPSALDELDEIFRQARRKRLAVFLDYDGTLAPIVDTPDKAFMQKEMRAAVIELSRHCTVGIISGRDRKDVQRMANIDSIIYAGSHGFDISGPDGFQLENEAGTKLLPILDQAEKELFDQLEKIKEVLVERKRFAIAIHYRLVASEKVDQVEEVVDKVAAAHPELRKAYGKKIFELQPDIDWHKGKALLTLLSELKMDSDDVLPFYIGDDVTDEDAFKALRGLGIGIVVRNTDYETAAVYSLKSPDEVLEFLLKMIPACRRSP
jgi:trehalose 6-phosphate phosphatase